MLDIKQNSANKLSTLNANIENIEKRTETLNAEINYIETKKIEQINETRSWFFKNLTKLIKL